MSCSEVQVHRVWINETIAFGGAEFGKARGQCWGWGCGTDTPSYKTVTHSFTNTRSVAETSRARSTSSCSCRAGWQNAGRRSGRWLAGLPSKARGCWTGWCQSTWPSCCWCWEDRSLRCLRRQSCWRGGRPPTGMDLNNNDLESPTGMCTATIWIIISHKNAE